MSDPISVKCPSCKTTLKLKSRSAVGKKVSCPKCKKPFVVQAPPEDDDMAFLNDLDPSEMEDHEAQDEEEEVAPAPVRRSSAGAGRKSKKPQQKSGNWMKPVLFGLGALFVLCMLGGGGYLAFTLIDRFRGQNKIDLSYLAPDCELIVHARVDEVLGSPLAKSVLAIPSVQQGLDAVVKEYQVSLSDVKSMTVGVKGVDLSPSSMMPMPGMGAMGQGRFPPRAGASQNARGTIVIRLSKSLPADFTFKLPATTFLKTEYHGGEYFRPLPQAAAKVPSLYIPAADVLVAADESEVQRIIDNGPRQTRRSEFDFIDAGPQIVIAMLNKEPASGAAAPAPAPGGTPGMGPGGTPPGMAMGPGMGPGAMGPGAMGPGAMGPGGMPGAGGPMTMGMGGGGMPGVGGMNDIPSLTGGKLKAWYLGLSFTQDLDIQTGFYCPESATAARGELEKSISQTKANFAQQKAQLAMLAMFGLGDIVPYIEQTLNSFAVQEGEGPTVTVTARIPGGIKSAIEKAIPTLSAFAGGGAGGLPAGFGAGGPSGDGAPNSLGDAEPPEEVAEEPATPPTGQP